MGRQHRRLYQGCQCNAGVRRCIMSSHKNEVWGVRSVHSTLLTPHFLGQRYVWHSG
jgi:hypothetical protein